MYVYPLNRQDNFPGGITVRIATSAQMKQIEKNAAASGLSYYTMMENAAHAVVKFTMQKYDLKNSGVLILCGRGNNGGDGLAAARLFQLYGIHVTAALVCGLPTTEDSLKNLEILKNYPVEIIYDVSEYLLQKISGAAVIIDAIYGTGFHGSIRENMRQVFDEIKRSKAVKISVDLPSGVNSDTAEVAGGAISSNFTVALDCYKPAHMCFPSKEYCGESICADIGISDECRDCAGETFKALDDDYIFSCIPERPENSNKGTFGKLLCVAGSLGMTGAGRLCAMGAHRCGTGLVTLASPRSACLINSGVLTETVFLPLDETQDGTVSKSSITKIMDSLHRSTSCVLGCGLGCNGDTRAVAETIIKESTCPLLIDADGLNSIKEHPEILKQASCPIVLSPHPAEMARLCGLTVKDVIENRINIGREFSKEFNVILILKGSATTVFSPDGRIFINTTGNSGLAKGGSGDILSGMVSGFMAQGISPLDSALCGVFLHGKAGDKCSQRLSKTGMQPSDILTDLCEIFLEHNR